MQPFIQYQRSNYTLEQYIHVACKKLFSKKSWKEWEADRKDNNLPILKKKILQTYKEVLEEYNIQIIDFEDLEPLGSYVDINSMFEQYAVQYKRKGWLSQEKHLYFKISFDNTKLTKCGSEGFWIVPTNVKKPQHNRHCWEIARYRGTEKRALLKKVMEQMDLDGFISENDNSYLDEQTVKFFFSADWIALVGLFWVHLPNDRNWAHSTCMFCSCPKEVFKTGYIRDPFAYILGDRQVEDFPNFPLQSLEIEDIHYDPMHGMGRVLTLVLTHICRIILNGEKGRYTACISYFLGDNFYINFDIPQGISPIQMKRLIGKTNRAEFLEHILTFFDDTNPTLIDLNQTINYQLTNKNKVELLLQAVIYFFDFVYKRYPTEQEVINLDKSRTVFMAVFADNNWNMEVSVHYIMNHMFERLDYFLLEKGSFGVYSDLCEGTENENCQIKYEKIVLGVDLPGITNVDTHRSRRAIERKNLKLIFSFLDCPLSWKMDRYQPAQLEPTIQTYRWMDFIQASTFIIELIENATKYDDSI